MQKIPALSIRQPWAYAILHGKDIENRNWKTAYRGPILIHAGATMPMRDYREAARFIEARGVTVPHPQDLKRGGIIGRAELVDCVTRSNSPWFAREPSGRGSYGFVLANVEPLPFVPCAGRLGLFIPDVEVAL